jgi:hypothetical protein
MLSIEKYRKILNDYETPDEKIKERLEYIDSFFRNIIRIELETYEVKEKEGNPIPQPSEEATGR